LISPQETLLHLSLDCLGTASPAASAAAALLRPLLSSSAAAPQPFEALAQRLLALADVPGAARRAGWPWHAMAFGCFWPGVLPVKIKTWDLNR